MTASNSLLAKKRCIVRDANLVRLSMSYLVSTTTIKWCSTFRTITEGEGPPVDSTSIAAMADFDDLFHSLKYTENDPNWTVPKD